MSSDNQEASPDPNEQKRQPTSELWGPWGPDRPQYRAVSGIQFKRPAELETPPEPKDMDVDPQFSHREHVSGSLPSDPSEAPLFRPAYPPYPGYQPQGPGYPQQWYAPPGPGTPPNLPPGGYPPQRPGYAPYPSYQGNVPPGYPAYAYPYGWQPPEPKRDNYLLAVAIISLIGSSLVIVAGLGCAGLLALFAAVPHTGLSDSEVFATVLLFLALACAGIVGGGFGLYHSIRSVFLRKPSADFSMPQFWIFVLLYLGVIGVAYLLQSQGLELAFPALTAVLIALAGIFPALAVLALGVRRLHFPRSAPWPTSWRRFTLALVSGATLSFGLAGLLELAALALLVRVQAVNPLLCIDQPNAPNCQGPGVYNLILIVAAVIAPVIEEAVKPLAVIVLIGRVRSAAETFVLGLACGTGFDLIETTGYIGAGYHDWLSVALIRTWSGLLHGFGAAMVALGWYYLTHPGKHRLLKTMACWLYAVAQHAVWNGSWGLALLPAPIGQFFNNSVTIGPVSLPSYEIINIGVAIVILAFFIYMTGKLRTQAMPPSSLPEKGEVKPMSEGVIGVQ